jgi:hypothetical protein
MLIRAVDLGDLLVKKPDGCEFKFDVTTYILFKTVFYIGIWLSMVIQ